MRLGRPLDQMAADLREGTTHVDASPNQVNVPRPESRDLPPPQPGVGQGPDQGGVVRRREGGDLGATQEEPIELETTCRVGECFEHAILVGQGSRTYDRIVTCQSRGQPAPTTRRSATQGADGFPSEWPVLPGHSLDTHAAARSSSRSRSRVFRVSEAASFSSARASSRRPSFASKSPRTLGSRW